MATRSTQTVCSYYTSETGCKRGDQCKFVHPKQNEQHVQKETICLYYSSPGGCKNGSKCRYTHPVKDQTAEVCIYFNSKGGCKNGEFCEYQHVDGAGIEEHKWQKKDNDEDEENKSDLEDISEDTSKSTDKACMILEELHDKWYKNKDVNVKNLGVYLKNVVDGYRACRNKELNFGYVKFGTYSRTFCEVLCNYVLKGDGFSSQLKGKMTQVKEKWSGFPYDEMDYIRKRTNRIVHGVHFNEDARKRFISVKEQQQVLLNVCTIATWLKVY